MNKDEKTVNMDDENKHIAITLKRLINYVGLIRVVQNYTMFVIL